ncbi:MAG: BMP family ABC transporter substrate-binding protein [Fimbriimonadales bacterium]|nr:BMP family ABC transporter substrate-binding protein [Armatimonadota bacterium]MCX7686818.1 BMP family ABC transporter substrate-binding protein [Fimbriimonadales bacterium]GBC90728.1 Membrane lipoprotein TmpC [bacterium HR14]
MQRRIRAAMVTDVGGIGDESFNASAWRGLERARDQLGAEVRYLESRTAADYVRNLTALARQGFNVVFAIGFLMEDSLAKVAPRFPKVYFGIVDGRAPNLPNCVSLIFNEQEGSYLVGALAGAFTKTNVVGFVGGMNVPLIKKFEYGYRAGVLTTNPKAKVLVGYTGNWDDVSKGRELALTQFNQGADIIYHAAGRCGIGVIRAAQQKGKGYYAIGVDSDQDHLAPGHVLTSMMKRVDNAVFDVCKRVAEGRFKSGTIVYGVKEKGVGLSPMRFTRKLVPDAIMAKINKLEQLIVQGKVVPPYNEQTFRAFRPPKV